MRRLPAGTHGARRIVDTVKEGPMQTSTHLRVRPIPVAALRPAQVDRMWQLYADFYDHVDRPTFERDLKEKSLVFLGTDAISGAIVGFSTALFFTQRHAGRTAGVYFSGDTIVHPRYWGQTALHRAVVGELLRWKLRHPTKRLYWYLICSGCRTYLTLVRNFPTHWPHHARATPAWERGLLDAIGRRRYGAAWRVDRGVISFDGPQPVLKSAVAPITPDMLAFPEIAFFVRANPGHLEGDELAMVGRVDVRAVTGMVAKWLRKGLRRRRAATRDAALDAHPAHGAP